MQNQSKRSKTSETIVRRRRRIMFAVVCDELRVVVVEELSKEVYR
jgi:hypothetical protein